MSNQIPIESKDGMLGDIEQKEDIRWSTAVYGQPAWSRVKRYILSILGIKSQYKEDGDDPSQLYLKETHHHTYGRPWITGKYQLDFIKSIGLKRSQKLLDFGCGSGRFGIKAINYLDSNNYCGLDSHLPSLQAFAKYELVLNDLSEKKPRLLCSNNFEFTFFDSTFDWIMDFYVSRHIKKSELPIVCNQAYQVLSEDGRYVLSPPLEEMKEHMIQAGFIVEKEVKQEYALLDDYYPSSKDSNNWIVFRKNKIAKK